MLLWMDKSLAWTVFGLFSQKREKRKEREKE
jgi:hypothetical protein